MSHGALLRNVSDDPELASHVMHDYRNADLDSVTRAMLDFATKLTREPAAMEESDVIALRDHGLTDEQILSVVLITCTFNFMTRLADGLGVEVPARAPVRSRDLAHKPSQEPTLAHESQGVILAVRDYIWRLPEAPCVVKCWQLVNATVL